MLGLTWKAIPVSLEDEYGLRGESVREAIEKDTAEGLIPFFVGE